MIIKIYLLVFFGVATAMSYIYDKIDPDLLISARQVGEEAKTQYFNNVIGIQDERKRNNYYLDALQKCDMIGNEQTRRIELRAKKEAKLADAAELQKIGFKEFTAMFMTLQLNFMKEVIKMACSKHEQQLQCGSMIEGNAIIEKRIDDLKTIGNHLMMFEYECSDPSYVNVYPCIGTSVQKLRKQCAQIMDQYWEYRESANANISTIYETALAAVKHLKATSNQHQSILNSFIFKTAMKTSFTSRESNAGFSKWSVRSCALPVIKASCGAESMKAMNTSISLGYLRTERKERLHLDFDVFKIPIDPRCEGL